MQTEFQNTLYTHDNLFVLCGMNSEIADLIYLDPPFNSKRMYSGAIGSKAAGVSFKDMWTWSDINDGYLEKLMSNKHIGLARFIRTIELSADKAMMAYIAYMTQRIIELHRVLKPTGSFYLHCDPTASHYLKQVLDFVFGRKNFRNEIVWHYQAGTKGTKYFGRKHDIILFYSKSEQYKHKRVSKPVVNPERYKHTDDDGRKYDINGQGKRYYLDDGQTCDDVWTWAYEKEFQQVNSQSKEKTGYPTQKPLALLKRIIEASSNVGDIVLDPFCGCATTCVAAQQLGRKWIGIDIEKQAVKLLIKRLSDDAGLFTNFIHLTTLPQRTDVERMEINPQTKNDIKKRLFKEQGCRCNGCDDEFEIRHFEVDHIVPKAKGGGDYFENYQLLCSSCNRIKGDRPMEYLRMKMQKMEEALLKKITFGE